jgi:hypothetical protein
MTSHLPGSEPGHDRKEKRMSERLAIVVGAGGLTQPAKLLDYFPYLAPPPES